MFTARIDSYNNVLPGVHAAGFAEKVVQTNPTDSIGLTS
jgi:hypothetical protein